MAERITPEKGLDLKTTRKPCDWSECAVLSKPTKGQEDYLKGLSLFPVADDHGPMGDLVKPAADGYLVRMPQRFLAKHKGAYYYVNTEGYSYCRYALRVPASLFGADEPTPAPAPIFEDKTATEVTESLQLEAYKLISGEKDSKMKKLVLAASILTSWLALKGYPDNTKHLAKAVDEIIADNE